MPIFVLTLAVVTTFAPSSSTPSHPNSGRRRSDPMFCPDEPARARCTVTSSLVPPPTARSLLRVLDHSLQQNPSKTRNATRMSPSSLRCPLLTVSLSMQLLAILPTLPNFDLSASPAAAPSQNGNKHRNKHCSAENVRGSCDCYVHSSLMS